MATTEEPATEYEPAVDAQAPEDGPTSQIRPLEPNEFTRRQEGAWSRWEFHIKSKGSKMSRLQRLWILLSFRKRRRSWKKALSASRLRLLVKFALDLAREGGFHYWAVLAIKLVSSFIPAAELYCDRQVLNCAQLVAAGKKFSWTRLGAALLGRVASSSASTRLHDISQHSESIVGDRFRSRVRLHLLRLHLNLPDEKLQSPDMLHKMVRLERFGGHSTHPPNIFALASSAQGLVTVALEMLTLSSQITRSSAPVFLLSYIFMVVLPRRSYSSIVRSTPASEWELTDDRFATMDNLIKALRREVRVLGLRDWLLDTVTRDAAALEGVSTVMPRSDRYDQGGIAQRLSQFSSPITYAVFTILQSLAPPGSPLPKLGDVAFAQSACSSLFWRLHTMQSTARSLSSQAMDAEVYYELQNLGEAEQPAPKVVYESRTRDIGDVRVSGMHIEFRNVSLRYPHSLSFALEDVSFIALPGELVSIVGHNGCGKSTLFALLAGTIKPTEGKILINGQPMQDYDPHALHTHSSFVFQTSPSLPFTISDYISLGAISASPSASDDRSALVQSALSGSGAASFVSELPDGVHSYPGGVVGAEMDVHEWHFPPKVEREEQVPLLEIPAAGAKKRGADYSELPWPMSEMLPVSNGEVGVMLDGKLALISYALHAAETVTLSGGQWQKISLARSLAKPTGNDLLCWDEPAASLDALAEQALFGQILERKGTATILFSTHRFNVTPKADKILMFSSGRLVEQGTHAELLKSDGEYAKLWRAQAEGFQV